MVNDDKNIESVVANITSFDTKKPSFEKTDKKEEILSKSFQNSINSTENSNVLTENFDNISQKDSSKTIDPVSENSEILDESLAQKRAIEENDNLLFSKLFPGILRENVEKDEDFKLFARTKAKNVLFTSLYSDYLALVERISASATEKALFSMQNKLSSPGSLASGAQSDGFYTKEQVLAMSQEEIKKNYEKIRKSQQNW